LAKVADGIVLLRDACERAQDILATVEAPFTASEAMQVLRTTRRITVPLLELLDREASPKSRPAGTRNLRV
jgi:selenocysteine-specific elongation factor